jgi:hypothetical protein
MLKDSSCWTGYKFDPGHAWVDLLLMAARKEHYTRVRSMNILVPRGYVVAGSEFLAARWRWSRGKVSRFLQELARNGQIELKTAQKMGQQTEQHNEHQTEQKKKSAITCILISKWNEYQEDGTANETAKRTSNGTDDRTSNGHQTDIKRDTQENGLELNRIEDNTPLSPPMGGVPVVVPGVVDEPPVEETAGETGTRRRRASSLTGLDLAGRIVRVVLDGMGYNGKDLNDWGLQFDRLMKERGETVKNLVAFCTWYEEHHGDQYMPRLDKPWDLFDKWVGLCQASKRDY